MAKHQVVSQCNVSKGLLGSWKIEFNCPGCDASLTTKESAIGNVDDCQLCGAQFVFSPSVRDKIAEIQLEAESRKHQVEEQKRRKEDEFKRQATAAQATARQNAEDNRRKENQIHESERQREIIDRQQRNKHDHSLGYAYPNLKAYQTGIELIAISGAAIMGIAGICSFCMAAMGNMPGVGIISGVCVAFGCFFVGALWYFSYMVCTELLRLTITVALDIRAIRDQGGYE